MKKAVLFLIFIVCLAEQLTVLSGCANIIPPQGGPRDTLPPIVVRSSPHDSTRNFSGDRINFVFDEFIDAQDAINNMIVSPLNNRPLSVTPKLNTLSVKLRDTLEPNTTYTIDFGNTIKDVNEGNVAKRLTYIFSTGPYIDSLQLQGRVILAENGAIDTTLIVILHKSGDDSAVIKEKPRYVARLDNQGRFVFKNLPPATFHLYALKNDGGVYRYLSEKDLFGFAAKPATTGLKPDSVLIYAYAVNPAPTQPILAIGAATGPLRNRAAAAAVDKRLKYQTNLINNQQDLLGEFYMTFDQPLRIYDSTKIALYTDTTFVPATNYSFVLDSARRKLTLRNTWKEATLYRIILNKDFADDSSARKLFKTDTLSFTTKKLGDYGSLKLRFRNLDLSKNPVLQFVINGNITSSFPLTSNDFSQTVFLPGEYQLRILYDVNKNGEWDPGEFFGKHRQPEVVEPVSRKVIVKPNYPNEFEINL